MAKRSRDPYLLRTVDRACSLLLAFGNTDEALRMTDIVARTGLNRTIAFRILHTLKQHGMIQGVGNRQYKSNVKLAGRKRFRIGYAAQAEDTAFSAAVTDGLRLGAAREQIDLIVLDNRYSTKATLRNAEMLIEERVDLAMEFQTFEKLAPVIASRFHEAGIPLIAIEIPHPGATFYGVDNYRVGQQAGRILGNWAKRNWSGEVERVLLMGLEAAGSLPRLRLSGAEAGIREVLPAVSGESFTYLDCNGEFSRALEVVRRQLRVVPRHKTLIAGVNDPSVLGALRAFDEAGMAELCAGLGLGAYPEARAELRQPGTRLIGSIAFFPELYGEDLIRLALDILNRRHTPPAAYARSQLITAGNVDRVYPEYKADATPRNLRTIGGVGADERT